MLQSCPNRIDCDTALLTNYSSEGAEAFPPYYAVVYPDPENPIDQQWSALGCVYLYVSYISQEDADLHLNGEKLESEKACYLSLNPKC